jgi:hypothetical protein
MDSFRDELSRSQRHRGLRMFRDGRPYRTTGIPEAMFPEGRRAVGGVRCQPRCYANGGAQRIMGCCAVVQDGVLFGVSTTGE